MRFALFCITLSLVCSSYSAPISRLEEWHELLLATMKSLPAQPFWMSMHHSAVVHTSIYDALVDLGCKRHHAYCTTNAANLTVSFAGQYAMKAMWPDKFFGFEAKLEKDIQAEADTTVRERAKLVGEAAAKRVVKRASVDGTSAYNEYAFALGVEGRMQPIPPFFTKPLLSYYADVDPFVLPRPDYLVSPGPIAYSSAQYKADAEEVQIIGAVNSTTRTAYQTAVARFADMIAFGGNPETIIGTYSRPALNVTKTLGYSMFDTSAVLMLLCTGVFDGLVANMGSKIVHDQWRPLFVIRNGIPSNPTFVTEPTWTPLLFYNNNSEFPGGHATLSGSACQILINAFGFDTWNIEVPTGLAGAPMLHHSNFTSFMYELGGPARIWAGLHFRFSVDIGFQFGRDIGDIIYDRACRNGNCFEE